MSFALTHLIGFGARRATSSAAAHRYWKWKWTDNQTSGAFVEFAELELLIGGTDQTSPSTTISQTGTVYNSVSNLVDNSASTNWQGDDECEVTIDLGSAMAITDYTVTARNVGSSYTPKAWNFYYSDDGTSFTLVHSQSAQSFTNGQKKTYTI